MELRSRPVVLAAALLLLVTACVPKPETPVQTTTTAISRAPNQSAVAPSQLPQLATDAPGAGLEGKTTKVVKVGLLLPLTGRSAELGRAMQDAATISLFDKYARLPLNQQGVRVQLLPKDTGDSPEMARKAMQSALADGAELIIGPIFSDATEASAPLASAKHIGVLSFSNNHQRTLAPNTYLLGFSPRQQAMRVVDFAFKHEKRRIAVLVPKSALGDEVLAAARASAKAAGIALVAEGQYSPQGMGLDAALAKMVPTSGEAPRFDALLLAEGGPTLETILRALSARGINGTNVQLLGTGIWDDIPLLQRVNLDGAWFASSAPANTAQFEGRFRVNYKYTPPRIASLAYDAVALAVTLATSGRPYTADNLTNPAGFVGPANGIFRMQDDGMVERGLAVIQVNGSSLQMISPAPTGFIAN